MTDQNTILPQNQNAKWPDPPWSTPPYVVQTYQPLVIPQSLQGNSLFQSIPSWVFQDSNGNPATIDIDFANNRAFLYAGSSQGLLVQPSVLLSTTRASAETYTDTSGNITYVNSNIAALGNNGLQVWEARTNMQLDSQFQTAWSVFNAVQTSNAALAPDGTTTAASLADNTNNTVHNIFKAASANPNVTQTGSIYLKQGTLRYAQVELSDTTNGATVNVDLGAGAISGGTAIGSGVTYVSSDIVAVANGWYRVDLTATSSGGVALAYLIVRTASALGTVTYAGTGQNIYVWGAQNEQASFVSPLIPTTSGTAARSADAINLTTPPVFGAGASLVIWGMPSAPNGYNTNQVGIVADDGTTNNVLELFRRNTTFDGRFNYTESSTNSQTAATTTWAQGAIGKLAASGLSGAQIVVFNGGNTATNTQSGTPVGLVNVHIGALVDPTQFFDGTISRIAIWPTLALSSADLQRITT